MGYRTSYNLDIKDVDEQRKSVIIDELREFSEWAHDAIDGDGNCAMETSGEPDDELREFSQKHHDLVFEIQYTGDESEDFGYIYFKNGKMQQCEAKITFDEYDESKLK